MQADPSQDGWDWPYILYVGRVWLRYTDEQIWRLTPRQFFAQLRVHGELLQKTHGASAQQQESVGYIDQIPGW